MLVVHDITCERNEMADNIIVWQLINTLKENLHGVSIILMIQIAVPF